MTGTLPGPGALRALAVGSALELASVAVLLLNLATVHLRAVTATLGPVHGALYVCVAAIALVAPGLRPRTRWMAVLPAIGGVLTLVNVRQERRRCAQAPVADAGQPPVPPGT